jgi:hypothetical protein
MRAVLPRGAGVKSKTNDKTGLGRKPGSEESNFLINSSARKPRADLLPFEQEAGSEAFVINSKATARKRSGWAGLKREDSEIARWLNLLFDFLAADWPREPALAVHVSGNPIPGFLAFEFRCRS